MSDYNAMTPAQLRKAWHSGLTDTNELGPIMREDQNRIGTERYAGIAFYWNHHYRHTMRELTNMERVRIHRSWIGAGLRLTDVTETHQRIIDRNLNRRAATQ